MSHTFRFTPFTDEEGRATRQKKFALDVFDGDCPNCGVEPPNHDASCSRFDSARYTGSAEE